MIDFYKNLKPEHEKYINPHGKKYNIFHPCRILIVGSSGSGKTNLLLNLINNLNCFEKYYLFVKLAGDDPLYEEVLVPKLQEAGAGLQYTILEKYTDDISELPDIRSDEINSDCQNLFVFDDMIDEEKRDLSRIESYFTKARKRNCSLIFISQDYYSTPIKIRRNCTHIIFTKINSDIDLQNIYRDLTKQVFRTFDEFKQATNHPFIIFKNETGPARYLTINDTLCSRD